jgi:chemotaxis signal transduction protein
MSAPADRLLTFELAGSLFALPVAAVLEVADAEPLAAVPTLPISVGGVVNHHGDAVPVLSQSALLDVAASPAAPAQLVIVSGGAEGEGLRLGLPVDRVIGLAPGRPAQSRDRDPVAERRNQGGRMLCVIDPQRLVARAHELIATSQLSGAAAAPARAGEN